MHATTEHVEKLVAERHSTVRKCFGNLLNAIASNSGPDVAQANIELDDALDGLGGVVAREHWPAWFTDLRDNTKRYRAHHKNGQATWIAHLKSIINNYQAIENYLWFSDGEEKPLIDVDDIIDKARQEYNIDGLYQNVVSALRVLAACEELDSAKAIKDLQEIIRILERARSGSFAGQVATWQFVRRFVPNLISTYLKRSAITGPAIEAFEQTATELNCGLDAAKDRISEALLETARSGFSSNASNEISIAQIPALPDLTSSEQ